MHKSNHTKSKSDTDFHSNKLINDDISGSLKSFQNNLLNDFNSFKKSEKIGIKATRKLSNLKKKNEESQFLFVFKKILIFKMQLDKFFFRDKLPLIKFDLDNTLEIINKKIDILKNQLIDECPILYKSVLIDKLNEFNVVIESLIETKPQEFYKEVKFAILTGFEKIRLEIFELLENLHETDYNENSIQDINKIKKECKFNHGILFNLEDIDEDDSDDDNNIELTSEIKENIISVILPRKNKILQFIEDITHDILFTLTKFSYIIDYYSLTVSNLNMQLFKNVISYTEKNCSNISSNKENITLFLIELIIILNRTFTKKSIIESKKKINSSESSIQNSMGKFILNNINELIPKCQGLDNNKLINNQYIKKSLFIQYYDRFLFYLKSYEDNKKIELVKSFKFYYDLKLIFWKSVYTKIDSNAKSSDICCRICEQNIPLNDFVLHVYYCKEQNHYYKKMNNFKSKIKKYINSLEIYKTKINQELLNREHNFFKKNTEMNKIFKKIKKENELLNIDKNNTNDFLHTLIKIYINENNKPNDYYEKNPDKLYIISTLIYLTYFIFILNKKNQLNKNENEDSELSDILGNILSYLIQILFNTEYLLEARHSRTKSNRYLNNMHYSFQSSSNDSFFSNTGRYHSSKNVVFNEFSVNNSQNISMNLNLNEERKKRRNSMRHQTFCMMMEDIKNKFSFNKVLLNQSKNDISQSINENIDDNESSISAQSSNSNFDKYEDKKNNYRRDSKSKTFKENKECKNFFELRSNSENKNEVFNFFFGPKKKSSGYKNNLFLDHKKKKLKNNIDNSSRRYFLNRETKSSKFLIAPKELELIKEPVRIGHKKSILNFDRKDSSIDTDNNMFENSISKEFFSQDKKNSNFESFSNSNNNSENEKDKNDNNSLSINPKHFLSAKTNNILNIKNEKKMPSLFLKSDKILLDYKPNLPLRDRLRKSLFQAHQSENNENNDNNVLNIINKNTSKNNDFEKLDNEESNKVPSENGDMENKDIFLNHQFEKVNIENKKRGASPDINKKKLQKPTLDKDKNLVLIDNYESSENENESESGCEDYNIFENGNSNNKNLILNLKPKNKENLENSNSSYDSDNEEDNNNNVIIETFGANEKKLKNDNQNNSFSRELSDSNESLDNIEEEQNWFNFDNNFFMNSDINSQNINIVNTIKELLCEINNDNVNEDEKDDKDNDECELENSKINSNLNNSLAKLSESSVKFSNFKLILPLAKGGYGTVGLYKKTSTGDMFAIKSVDINNMKEKKLSKTLQNERNILKGVSSDYVVNSYYIFKDNKNYYFVMEYLPGGDVYNLLSSIILPFSTIQLIIAETLLAVFYLHSINIIHHDIKPENILISKDGHFKLSDFGLSKTINEKGIKNEEHGGQNKSPSNSSNSSSLDSDNEYDDNKTEGTLFYMAPELFTNDFPVGKSIDYWAIGIVLYELFTFKVPFEAETQEQTRQNIIDYNINWEPMYSEEVSKNYKNYIDCTVDLIKKFIFFNPEQRWGDNNFKDIQNHEFFKGFDWVNIKKIKNSAVLSHLKKIVEKNNKKIKELNKEKRDKSNGNLICEVDLAYDESNAKFSQRIDNLQKRNNELKKMKFKKKEIKIEDDDKNFKHSLFFDLQ